VARPSAAWFTALTLAERLAVSRPGNEVTPAGRARLARWRRQPPFDTHPDLWSARLAEAGLDEETFASLLSETADDLHARVEPLSWMTGLDAALDAHADGRPLDPLITTAIASEPAGYPRAVLRLVAPFVAAELPRLREGLDAAERAGAPLATALLLPQLLSHIVEVVDIALLRTCAFEVSVARARGLLAAESPTARFEEFIAAVTDGGALRYFYERHPVLARHVATAVAGFVGASCSFFAHFAEDWRLALERLGVGVPPGPLVEVRPGAGDTHRGGRTVIQLRFESGLRIVYKPRSGEVDEAFVALLAWLEGRGAPDLAVARAPRSYSRGERSWSAFVERTDAADRAAVGRFYQRQGAHLALFYVLGAADMHADNMIASGEHPVLIDLEALFTPRIPLRPELEDTNPAAESVLASVLGALFLPLRLDGTAEAPGFDVSALGNRAGQMESRESPVMKGVGTDEMRIEYDRAELDPMTSRPKLAGEELDAAEWVADICKGFTETWGVLARHRDELVSDVLPRFRDASVRLIPRATRIYGKVLTTSFHPSFLDDGLERERVFDRLWLAVRYEPLLARLIPSEREDLHGGDVPFFAMRPASGDVTDSRGRVIEHAFAEAAFEQAVRRARSNDDDEMHRQLWLVRASFATIPTGEGQKHWVPSNATLEPALVTREALIERALSIGERIEELASWRDGRVGWLAIGLQRERDWSVLPTQTDLYNGTPGIALFLAMLGAVTGEAHWTDIARAAVMTALPRLDVQLTSEVPLAIGAIGEIGGMLFTLAHLGALTRDASLFEAAHRLVARMPRHVEASKDNDVAEGHAGCIFALLALHAASPSNDALRMAERCGQTLRARAVARGAGVAWPSTVPSAEPLAGFSHGASGIALALLRLAAATGDATHRDLAKGAFAYERALFDGRVDNWPDLRAIAVPDGASASAVERTFTTQWCHGSPGIGLARLAARELLDDARLEDEARAAVRSTLRAGFGLNHSLCHGDFGNLELLFAARDLDGAASASAFTERLGRACASLDRQGPLPGVPLGIETAGLFVGLAGIGWQLLRFAEPARVPSLLVFDPPA
jgi:type 2 lantibiotic biosynthesis protein LanM